MAENEKDDFGLGYRDKVDDKIYERLVEAKTNIAHGWIVVAVCLAIGFLLSALWEPLFFVGVGLASFFGGPRLLSGYIDQYRYRKD